MLQKIPADDECNHRFLATGRGCNIDWNGLSPALLLLSVYR